MTPALTPLRGKRISWTTLLGLLLVPLTVAGLFLWGLWNPSDRLDTVTAAVVNQDEPVEVDGQLVPLGRVLAAELIAGGSGDAAGAGQNFTWVLTDAEDAAAGLKDGRFATSITIPKGFSAAATSLAGGPEEARQATIHIAESDRGRLLDTALSGIVTQTATRVLNQQLGEQFIGSVFVGMSTLGDGVQSAADGAGQLADGSKQLASGAGELATGTTGLADGVQQLSGGAQQLAGGASELVQGTQQLATGGQALSGGAAGLAAGATDLATGTRASANGSAQLAGGVEQYTGLVNGVLDTVIAGAGQALEPLQQLRASIDALPEELFPPEYPKADVLATLDKAIAEVSGAAGGSNESQLVQLRQAGADLATGARAAANGQAELATGAEDFAAGAHSFAGGVSTFAGGVSQLAGQTPALAAGAQELAGGVSQVADGAGELAGGAGKLAEGAGAAATGTQELADGLVEAATQIPKYTERERETMAGTAIESVTSEGGSDELFNASGVPLFAGIALWAGALAAFLVLSPLWSRTRDAAKGVLAITARSAGPAVLLGAAQGAIAGIVLPLALGYGFAQAAGFFGLAVLAGVAFALVVQGLSARFGGFGRFAAFALLVVAFVVGIVSTVPGLLATVGDASPIGAAFTGFQAIAAGAGGAGGAAALLVLWGAAGVALTGWSVARARRG
ncbi:YhgE/Pip family protein [Leucobacter albus]|uniref:YhgE/Pip family protein n=1 Tax=Leucobacter albus TaxID=272210 RepID=A0ABW3TRL0_9MICO